MARRGGCCACAVDRAEGQKRTRSLGERQWAAGGWQQARQKRPRRCGVGVEHGMRIAEMGRAQAGGAAGVFVQASVGYLMVRRGAADRGGSRETENEGRREADKASVRA
jgi:hypothetical protein